MNDPQILVVQPALPSYRIPFFRRVAARFPGLRVLHSRVGLAGLEDRDAAPPWSEDHGPLRTLRGAGELQPGVLEAVKRSRPDLLVLSGNIRNLTNFLLLRDARRRAIPVVWWSHYRSGASSRLGLFLRVLVMRYCDATLFYTDEEILRFGETRLGRWHRGAVFALNNGLERSAIDPHRAPYSAAERPLEILCIGRASPKARLDLLVRALGTETLSDVHCHVIGSGDGLAEQQRLAARCGADQHITWHPATTDEAAIARIANRCRLLVYPGDVGLSLLHGLSYGLPAIVHRERDRHMPEIAAFRAGVTGAVFRRGDAEDLARTIGDHIHDPESLDRWSRAALEVTAEDFNCESMAIRFAAVVADVLERRSC